MSAHKVIYKKIFIPFSSGLFLCPQQHPGIAQCSSCCFPHPLNLSKSKHLKLNICLLDCCSRIQDSLKRLANKVAWQVEIQEVKLSPILHPHAWCNCTPFPKAAKQTQGQKNNKARQPKGNQSSGENESRLTQEKAFPPRFHLQKPIGLADESYLIWTWAIILYCTWGRQTNLGGTD